MVSSSSTRKMARLHWPDEDPIGRQLVLRPRGAAAGRPLEVVGVVGDGHEWSLPTEPPAGRVCPKSTTAGKRIEPPLAHVIHGTNYLRCGGLDRCRPSRYVASLHLWVHDWLVSAGVFRAALHSRRAVQVDIQPASGNREPGRGDIPRRGPSELCCFRRHGGGASYGAWIRAKGVRALVTGLHGTSCTTYRRTPASGRMSRMTRDTPK